MLSLSIVNAGCPLICYVFDEYTIMLGFVLTSDFILNTAEINTMLGV